MIHQEPTCLQERQYHIGILTNVIEPSDGPVAQLVVTCHGCQCNREEAVAVSPELVPQLRKLVGRKVNISKIGDDIRVCEVTECR